MAYSLSKAFILARPGLWPDSLFKSLLHIRAIFEDGAMVKNLKEGAMARDFEEGLATQGFKKGGEALVGLLPRRKNIFMEKRR